MQQAGHNSGPSVTPPVKHWYYTSIKGPTDCIAALELKIGFMPQEEQLKQFVPAEAA
ncbi:hypothetical protein TWF173_004760 [Orbilia oligospora]|nr:hypothetical protein TWF173_004760 [Orbilia oligospora]